MFSPLSTARTLYDRITGRSRRVWAAEGRAHIEYRPVDADDGENFAGRLVEVLTEHDEVRSAAVNPYVQRVVVAFDDLWVEVDTLVGLVEDVEREFGIADRPFDVDRPDHPGDIEPLLRESVQLVSNAAGVATSVYGRFRSFLPGPGPVDVSWLATLSSNVPQLRQAIDQALGERAADVALGVSNSLLRGIRLGLSGHVVDVAQRVTRIRELNAVRGTWHEREPQLAWTGDGRSAVAQVRPARAQPLPDGPIEAYARKVWPVAVGGFVTSLLATDDVEVSTTPLLDAIPKAARLGKESFNTQLVRVLAERGVLVTDVHALDCLDRIDTLVVEGELLTEADGTTMTAAANTLLRAVRGTPIRLVTTTGPGCDPIAVDDCIASRDVDRVVAELQDDGRVVMAVGRTGAAAFARADLRVGLQPDGYPPAWDADVLGGDDLADVLVLLHGVAAARRNSRQAVTLSITGAGIGATTGLGGLRSNTPRRVLQVVNAASLLAIANGARLATNLAELPDSLESDVTPWHELAADEVLDRLETTLDGLSSGQWQERFVAPEEPPHVVLRAGQAMGEELANPLTPILAGGAGLSLATGALTDAGMVSSVMGLNAVIGGAQRFRADRAVQHLFETEQRTVRVRRDGREDGVATADLVRGDVILLEAGEPVPADARIIEARNLEVDESHLTGESLPVRKSPEPVMARSAADRTSMLYQGTTIAAGEAVAVVVATGTDTESRRALTWSDQDAGVETGVEARLDRLTKVTIPLALLSGAGISISGLLRRIPTRDLVDAGVGLAIAAVPEGLPLLASAAQRAAARRLSKHRVLVRNPRAIEALGRVDVLCADKTGTLTEGRIRLAVVSDGRSAVPAGDGEDSHEAVLLAARRATPIDPDREQLPHPTDQAVAEGTRQLGVHRQNGGEFDILDDLPFEPGRAYHAVLADTADGRRLSLKGAPEEVLSRCVTWQRPDGTAPLTDEDREALDDEAERLAAQGLRVLAVAERDYHSEEVVDEEVDELAFVGFVGMRDPVRPVSAQSIERLRRAGIDVVMITGDHPTTARSIAAELGLADGLLLTGPDVDELDDDELADVLPKVGVFARVTPLHKVRIVRAFQQAGRVVAMTGDGANDAPAIRLADVGIAVGERATVAARETADVVVLDDRIEVIVDAIAEGRGLWGSVRDAVSVLVGGNLGEIAFTLLGAVIGRRPPLNTRQLLLVNLLTDVAPAMALAVRAPRADVEQLLAEGPERSLGSELSQALLWRGAGAAVGATTAFASARLTGSMPRARTAGLVALVGSQLGQTVVTSRGDARVIATGVGSMGVMATMIQTPGISGIVGCRPMGPVGWMTATAGAAVGTVVGIVGPSLDRRLGGDESFGARAVERLASLAPDVPGLLES